jgi:hypothetical protein
MEGKHLVRNASNNEVNYVPTTTAKVGDTLRYMVWYHNTMNENSGLNATNLNIKVSIPTDTATSHITRMTVTGSNTNTVSQTALVATSSDTRLEYVPGTASRRYNTGTNASPSWNTVSVNDSIVAGGYTIPTMKPCWNFEESIVFTVKVVAVPKTPTCTISASDSSIVRGDSAVLTYSSTNATSGSITGIGSVGTSGSRTVNPIFNTTYTYTVTGEGGNATCSTAIAVTVPPAEEPDEPEQEQEQERTQTQTQTQTQYVSAPTGKGNMPVSGPAEAAAGAVGITSTGGALWAWARSKKSLLNALTKIKK